MFSYSIAKSSKLTNTSRDHNSPSILHTGVPRRSVHAQNRSPPQRRPTSPRRRISRTRTRVSQRARPPTSTRRSPASNRTRARAARRWCPSVARGRLRRCHRLGRSERPPLAAAGRAALRQNLRHVEEASCTHGPAHPCAERARVHCQPAAWGSMRASRRHGTGERASKGAPRSNARTVEVRIVPELISMQRLSARAAARTSRAPPPGGS